jgi:hypothetical protein
VGREDLDRHRAERVRLVARERPLEDAVEPGGQAVDHAVPRNRHRMSLREHLVAVDEHELVLRELVDHPPPEAVGDVAVAVVLGPDLGRVDPALEIGPLGSREGRERTIRRSSPSRRGS